MQDGIFIGVAGVGVLVFTFVFGLSLGATSVKDQCDTLGKFSRGEVIYTCEKTARK